MKQRSIALTSLIGGVIGFGLAGMIQLDRTLLTTPRALPAMFTETRMLPARIELPRADKPALLENKLPDVQVLHLEPILITGSKRARWATPTEAPASPPRSPAPAAAALVVPDT